MRPKDTQRQRRIQRSLVLGILAAGGLRSGAQSAGWGIYQDDPMWYQLVPHLKYIKTDVEVEQSSYKPSGSASQKLTWYSVYPAAGIQWNNFLYSPYLLTYSVLFEPGYYWQKTGGGSGTFQTDQLMLNGSGAVNLLALKPYATTFTFEKTHQEVQSDFFSTETVDLQNWGVLTGYRDGPVPVMLTFNQSEEDRSGYSQDYVIDQTSLDLRASNERKNADTTVLDYQYNQYDNQSQGGNLSYSSESSSHHVNLTDSEHFRNSLLTSTLFYNERATAGATSSDLNAGLNYSVDHTPNLRSFYNYSFSDSSGTGYDAIQNSALAGINHQLYESLASHLDVHGNYLTSDSSGSSFGSSSLDSESYGLSASADYTKRLGSWARLTINNSATFDLTSQQASGDVQDGPPESYTLPSIGPLIIRLNRPQDIQIDPGGVTKNGVPLQPAEYSVITSTDPWQIQFFAGGLNSVTNGDSIVVTYASRVNPSGSYSVLTYAGMVGLRFWNDQAGLRFGYNLTQNNSDSPEFVLQDVRQYLAGADVTWRGFHLDASYTDERSTLYSFKNYSLNESYTLPLGLHSTVGLTLNQQWSQFPPGSGIFTNKTENLEFYSYMVHYDWHPAGAFALNAEAGLQQVRGGLDDQDLFAARVYLNWMINKLEIHAGYQHENRQYPTEQYQRDYFFLRFRRNF